MQIINIRVNITIGFSEEVYGLRRMRGYRTAIGKAKLRMQMATCRFKTRYQIYLDLRKAYDSIDRNRILRTLEKYKVGHSIRRYISET